MKKLIKPEQVNLKFDIEYVVEVIFPDSEEQLVASTYKGFNIPDGELLPSEKDAITSSQALADYYSFIECIEDLMTDNYDLEIYYKNASPYNSFYFGAVAKNSDGTLIFDFDLTLRVSNHNPHRTQQSQQYKKEKKAALKRIARTKKPTAITRSVIVNNDYYSDYLEAFVDIDEIIKRSVEILERKKH